MPHGDCNHDAEEMAERVISWFEDVRVNERGNVTKYDEVMKFGFIKSEEYNQDLFFHIRDVEKNQKTIIKKGITVVY